MRVIAQGPIRESGFAKSAINKFEKAAWLSLTLRWHGRLGMRRYDRLWHRRDVLGEIAELRQAKTLPAQLSEVSDVIYTWSRALHTGHSLVCPFRTAPVVRWAGTLYMLPKYSLRFAFYRHVLWRLRRRSSQEETSSADCAALSRVDIREVRNPRKVHKLREIAGQYPGLDPGRFQEECGRALKYWPLLP